ncbi:MAG: ABC transporter permease [Candidatus Nanohaloarchaeota archaeon QJJ-9]|nr:ABC transporter permease [Candidatus Nanohaloarchaeota archaeon QJJ-9]
MFLDFLRLALKNITHRKRRSWLTIIGILIGIAAVVSLVSLGQGLNRSISEEFESLGADKLFITPGGELVSTGSQFAQSASKLGGDDLDVIKRSRGIEKAAGMFARTSRVEYKGESHFLTVIGIPTGARDELIKNSWSLEVEDGRFLRRTDRSNVLIGSNIASGIFDNDIGVRSKINFEKRGFRVVGTLRSVGDPGIDNSIFLPLEHAEDLFGVEDNYQYITAQVRPGFTPEEARDILERDLRQHRGLDEGEEDFTVSTAQDVLDSFRNILNIVQYFVVGLASISLLVGGVGIMNTMYTSVTERTREIGVMKAVGARDKHILTLFILESGMIGLVGGAIGAGIGGTISYGAAYAIRQYTSIPFSAYVSPMLVAGSLGFAFLVGVLSGVFPARSAAKLDPADALRYE